MGEYTITIERGSVSNYNVTFVPATLTVMKAPLTISAGNYTKKQGEAMPEWQATYNGFMFWDNSSVLTKQPVFSCEANENSVPGEYPVMVSGAEAQNYDTSYEEGKLTVTESDCVVITVKNVSREYGEENPVFEYEVQGPALVGEPFISCEAVKNSPVGEYSITIEKGTVSNSNVSFVPGTLTITKAPLTISAGNYTMKRGEPMPQWQPTFTGFKNGETSEVLTKQPVFSCDATPESAPSRYRVTVSGAEAENYHISYEEGWLFLNDADLITVTIKNVSCEYGDELPEFEYEVTGGELVGEPVIRCEAEKGSPAGEYRIVLEMGSITSYNVNLVGGTLTITKAPLVINAGSYIKKQGDPMPKWQPVAKGLKNGDTIDMLNNQYRFWCDADEASAPGEYEVGLGGFDNLKNYAPVTYEPGTLTVIEADAVIVRAKSVSREYGDDNPVFEYEVEGDELDGVPVISCEAVPTSPVGEYAITLQKGTVKNYNVKLVPGTLTVTKAPLTIKAGTYTKKQGEVNPEFTLTYEGFKNNETSAVLKKQPTVACDATEASAPGEYPVTVSCGEADNYEISYVNGKLVVTQADDVIVKVKDATREYGAVNPTFEYTVEGATLDGVPEITCEATVTSPVGTYNIVVKQGTVKNYNVTFVGGTLTVTKAQLTIKAGTYTKKQGEAMPEVTLTYEGFKNNETKDVLDIQPTVTCAATEASALGEYPVSVSSAEAKNYDITYVDGKLIVVAADAVIVKVKDATREYGEDNPKFEYTVEGTLDGTPEISCEATPTSEVGTYSIIVKQGTVSRFCANFQISHKKNRTF